MKTLWVGLLAPLAVMACSGDGTVAGLRETPTPTAMVAPAPSPTVRAGTTATPPIQGPTATPRPAPSPASQPTATPVPAPLARIDVEPAFPGLLLREMVTLAYPADGTDRLFVALQPGLIVVFPNDRDVKATGTFLDIRRQVNDEGREEGLLGLAFDPDFRHNGYFYVYYTAFGLKRSVLSRFSVSRGDPNTADPNSERVVLEVPQPFQNHNGGQLVFGPDGNLYVALGDGGGGGDPFGNGQNTSSLLGSILRIDVRSIDSNGTYSIPPDNPFVGRGDGAREEIWAYGLRNPWRFTFDRETGDLWAADVGQDRFEEVDIIRPGLNYGWRIMEGLHCFPRPDEPCDPEGLEPPVIEYTQREGCSVIGGYVYRGARLPSLYGAYVYGDFCSGKIWALRYDGAKVTEHLELIDSQLRISSFGEDRSGELYMLSFDNRIYRLRPR